MVMAAIRRSWKCDSRPMEMSKVRLFHMRRVSSMSSSLIAAITSAKRHERRGCVEIFSLWAHGLLHICLRPLAPVLRAVVVGDICGLVCIGDLWEALRIGVSVWWKLGRCC